MSRKPLTFNPTGYYKQLLPSTETLEVGQGITSTGVGDLTITGSSGVVYLDAQNFLPVSDNFTNIGASASRFQTVHVTTLFLRGDATNTNLSQLTYGLWTFSDSVTFEHGPSGNSVLVVGGTNITVQDGRTLNCDGSGNINLPNNVNARFLIEGDDVSQNVTASNLNNLVNGSGPTDSLHTHQVTESLISTAGTTINVNEPVGMEYSGGVIRIFPADASALTNRHNVIGFAAENAVLDQDPNIRTSGLMTLTDAVWDVVPSASDVGSDVYLSTTAGGITLTAPVASGEWVQKLGVLIFAGGAADTTKILIQLGPSVQNP